MNKLHDIITTLALDLQTDLPALLTAEGLAQFEEIQIGGSRDSKKLSLFIYDNSVQKSVTETYKKFFSRIIPVCILAIVFCFIKWTPINSFGMITFWGIVIIAIYNATITNLLFRIKNK